MTPAAVPSVPPSAVRPGDLLLDVREDHEWQAGHAPGAVHIPLGELVARLEEVPSDRPVAVVCHSGGRSARATAYLLGTGRDARNVEGGMVAWAQAGLPVERGSTAP